MDPACDETRPGLIVKACSNAVSAYAAVFETKLETSRGFIGNGESPLCTRLGSAQANLERNRQTRFERKNRRVLIWWGALANWR